jgi:hypothetical protein
VAVTRIQNRRGTAAEWSSGNPVLSAGELGVELGYSDEQSLPFIDVAVQYGTNGPALNDAYAAAVAAGGGVLWLRPGTYTYSSNLVWDNWLVSIQGAGSDAVTLQAVGTAKIVVEQAVFNVQQGPKFSGFTVRADPSAPAGAIGIHGIDVCQIGWDDIVIEHFTGSGSIGLCLENDGFWTERNNFSRVHVNNCSIGVKCIGGGTAELSSFGFNRWTDLRINLWAGQIGFQVTQGAYVYNNTFNILCNIMDNGVIIDIKEPTSTPTAIVKSHMILTAEQTMGTGAVGVRVANGCYFSTSGYRSTLAFGDQNNNTLANGGTLAGTLRTINAAATVHTTPQSADGGTRPNFVGTGTGVMIPVVVDNPDNMYAAVGMIDGPNIRSVYFTAYQYSGNGWVFYAQGFGQSHGQAAEVARISIEGSMRVASYTTGTRPTASSQGVGAMLYDSTLGKPIWSNGTVWKDAAGTTV